MILKNFTQQIKNISIERSMSLKSFVFDRFLLLIILIAAGLILWWLTGDITIAIICLGTLIIISVIARLYQPWNEEKIIKKLSQQTQNKSRSDLSGDQ